MTINVLSALTSFMSYIALMSLQHVIKIEGRQGALLNLPIKCRLFKRAQRQCRRYLAAIYKLCKHYFAIASHNGAGGIAVVACIQLPIGKLGQNVGSRYRRLFANGRRCFRGGQRTAITQTKYVLEAHMLQRVLVY